MHRNIQLSLALYICTYLYKVLISIYEQIYCAKPERRSAFFLNCWGLRLCPERLMPGIQPIAYCWKVLGLQVSKMVVLGSGLSVERILASF